MGMYDTLWVPCKKCGEQVGFQTKIDKCILKNWNLASVPSRVIYALEGENEICDNCDAVNTIRIPKVPVIIE